MRRGEWFWWQTSQTPRRAFNQATLWALVCILCLVLFANVYPNQTAMLFTIIPAGIAVLGATIHVHSAVHQRILLRRGVVDIPPPRKHIVPTITFVLLATAALFFSFAQWRGLWGLEPDGHSAIRDLIFVLVAAGMAVWTWIIRNNVHDDRFE